MDKKYLLENYQKFKKADLSSFGSPLNQCLDALFSNLLQTSTWQGLERFAPTSEIDVYTVFDVCHDSDEQCELHILVYDGKPFGLAYKFGDKTDWDSQVLNKDVYLEVARYTMANLMEERLSGAEVNTELPSLNSLKNGYLRFVDSKETCFVVDNPLYALCFCQLIDEHRVFYPTDDGRILPVTQLIKFVEDNRWQARQNKAFDVLVVMEGVEAVVDSRRLVFELVAGEADLDGVLAGFPKEHIWAVELPEVTPTAAYIVYQQPGNWFSSGAMIHFESPEERVRFLEKFPPDVVYNGELSLKELGFKGKVSFD